MRNIITLGLVIIGSTLSGQITEKNLNKEYLEHLIKVKIDSVRSFYKCPELVNDSILYLAATHHSAYMTNKNELTHVENNTTEFKTPQDRANYFGAVNYGVGENVLMTPINTQIKNKKDRLFNVNNINELATSIVEGWVNSPGHFKNIITPSYNITGVSVNLDFQNQRLYACQKFAKVNYKYSFSENSVLFKYSGYQEKPVTTSFDGIDNTLQEHRHLWKIKHGVSNDCSSCLQVIKSKPPITLRVERRNFILKVEDSKYVEQLLKNKKDGFAVEIVQYEDYMCGNPSYYEKPSRRNGQCQLNGKVLPPIYSKDLLKGFKKRKRNADFKFLSYLFTKSETSFFRRFYTSNFEKYSSKYFEIKLGKVPKDVNGYWNHNLIYLQNNKICNVDYFTGYCGEVFHDSVFTEYVIPVFDTSYHFELDTGYLKREFRYQQTAHHFPKEELVTYLDSVKSTNYKIDLILVVSRSSIEGDSIKNVAYRTKRSDEFQKILSSRLDSSVEVEYKLSDSWKEFKQEIETNSELLFLKEIEKKEIEKRLKNGLTDSIVKTLENQRKSSLSIHGTLLLNEHTREYYVLKEYNRFLDSLSIKNLSDLQTSFYLATLDKIYAYAFQKINEGILDSNILSQLHFPNYYLNSIPLTEKIILAGVKYPSVMESNSYYSSNYKVIRTKLSSKYLLETSAFLRYNLSKIEFNQIKTNGTSKQIDIQSVVDILESINANSISSMKLRNQIHNLTYNMNYYLLNEVWYNEPSPNSENARGALSQILKYHHKQNSVNDSVAYVLSKIAIHFSNNQQAGYLLSNYGTSPKSKALLMTLGYTHISSIHSENYFKKLMKLKSEIESDVWCELFLNECSIPFQAFDSEQLRGLFCEECLDKNSFLREVVFKTQANSH